MHGFIRMPMYLKVLILEVCIIGPETAMRYGVFMRGLSLGEGNCIVGANMD